MALTDPIGDMLTRIRNAQLRRRDSVSTPASTLRGRVLDVLKSEGFIRGYSEAKLDNGVAQFEIELKYSDNIPVIRTIERVSRPGRRVYASVKKTSRVIVVYEDSISWGYGAEIAARIADDCFAWLDAPVKRVASTDTWVGYAPRLEDAILPQIDSIRAAIRDIATF